jgi:hypothetical protein
MSIKQILFSDDNVDEVVDFLLDRYDMEDDARDPVENMLRSLMTPIYKKNKAKLENIRSRDAAHKYVQKINMKAVQEFEKEYESYQNKDSRGRSSNRGGGSRQKKSNSRSRRGGGGGGNRSREPQGMYSGGGDSSYAPVASGQGGFITATGEVGDSMFFGNLEQQMHQDQDQMQNGLSAKDDIERRMLMRQSEYEGMNPYGNGMGMEMGMGMGMGGYGGMGGMNPMGNNQQPPEINFCVDGGDTRGIANGDAGQGMGGMGVMGMNSMGMDNMGMANNMQNGMMGSLNGDNMQMNNTMGGQNNMNPMMGMNGANPMMGGMNNMQMSGQGNSGGGDFNSRLAQMEAERGGQGIEGMQNVGMNNMQNMQNMQGQPQNPEMAQAMQMISALQQQLNNAMNNNNNNSNFQMGGRGGSSEIQNRIRDSKMEIAHRYDLDPEVLANMSPQQINELLAGDDSASQSEYESEYESDSDSESDNEGMTLKERVLAKIKKEKKKLSKENKKFDREVSTVKNKMKKKMGSKEASRNKRSSRSSRSSRNRSKRYQSDSDSDSDSESDRSESEMSEESDRTNDYSDDRSERSDHSDHSDYSDQSKSEDSESEDRKPRKSKLSNRKKNNRSDGRNDKKGKSNLMVKKRTDGNRSNRMSVTSNMDESDLESTVIDIKSDAWTQPEFLSDYHVDLDDPIQNLKKIELRKTDFPMMKPVIDETNNILCLVEQGDDIPIELESGDSMGLNDIIDEVNAALEGANIPIEIIEDRDAHIVIRSTSDEEFGLNFRENSIAPCFGFTEEEYDGETEYRSENQHVFLSQPYYLFIKEISNSPICEISPEGEVTLLLDDMQYADVRTKSNSNSKINGLTLNFRYDDSMKSDLVDFYDEDHKIGFRFYYATERVKSGRRSGSKNSNRKSDRANKSDKRTGRSRRR